MMSEKKKMAVAIEKAHEIIVSGEVFEATEVGDIYGGSTFFELCKYLHDINQPLTADDHVVAFNYDGVEIVNGVSVWPLQYMLYSIGELYRHLKEYIHVAGLAGSLKSPDDLNSFVWAMVLDMHVGFQGVNVTYTTSPADDFHDPAAPTVSKKVRYFMLVTVQDLMAMLKTTGLACSSLRKVVLSVLSPPRRVHRFEALHADEYYSRKHQTRTYSVFVR